ncbi:MAG: hypothetical protein ACHBN1_09480 [Heteroscytonema crispum UTEX LB 1556]
MGHWELLRQRPSRPRQSREAALLGMGKINFHGEVVNCVHVVFCECARRLKSPSLRAYKQSKRSQAD